MSATTAERVRTVVSQALRLDDVTENARFDEDLGADSLDMVMVLRDLEEAFGIEIPERDFERWYRVKDVVAYLDRIEGKATA